MTNNEGTYDLATVGSLNAGGDSFFDTWNATG